MKNKEITIYDLMGLIKDNKAPKQIKYNNKTFTFNEDRNDYENEYDKNWSFLYKRLGEAVNFVDDFLNNTVEILPEENDEWEDIEEFEIVGCNVKIKIGDNETFIPTESLIIDYVLAKENQLIKNQKYLKERLDKDEK